VIGGGVGGLTAAQELVERGFTVTIYEPRGWGGKARSQPFAGTGTGGRADLPGEHGFRFYPRFYRHVIDQMARVPTPGGGTVADRLRPTTEAAIAMIDEYTWYRFSRRQLDTPYSIVEALEMFFQTLDFDGEDVSIFTAKLLEFATSCDARRLAEYEQVSWWDFLEAASYSPKFQRQLRGIPRMMVAMDSVRGSARTIGTITVQLLMDFAFVGAQNDRTMGGPTTQMWIDPWIAHLASRGASLQLGPDNAAIAIDVAAGQVSGVQLAGGGTAVADFYVLAVPLDRAIPLITPQLGALDPALDLLRGQSPDDLVAWMTGIQFYLHEDVPLVRGHLFFPDSPWALTAISQPQFWRGLGLFRKQFGDGTVGGVLSVDISEWDVPGRFIPKIAKQCTPAEVAAEVWQQLKAAINGAGADEQILTDDLLHSWHLDEDVDYSGGIPPVNGSRLLVHPPGSWAVRPDAATMVPNLALASDYVRTHTNIASMEGACEAGRRAANAILVKAGSTAGRSEVLPLVEPDQFATLRRLDAWFHARGRPHLFQLLGIKRAVHALTLLRRLESVVGLAWLDDFLDQLVRPTAFARSVLRRIGFDVAN
jgi:15-cis-phytoene desaturase